MQPTYFVQHPDGSHSVADPQPVHPALFLGDEFRRAVALTEEIANILLEDNEYLRDALRRAELDRDLLLQLCEKRAQVQQEQTLRIDQLRRDREFDFQVMDLLRVRGFQGGTAQDALDWLDKRLLETQEDRKRFPSFYRSVDRPTPARVTLTPGPLLDEVLDEQRGDRL